MGARIRSLAARVRDLPPGRQDALLALAFFVEGNVEFSLVDAPARDVLLARLVLCMTCAGVALRRRMPILGATLMIGTFLVFDIPGLAEIEQATGGPFLTLFLAVYSVSANLDGRRLALASIWVVVLIVACMAGTAAGWSERPADVERDLCRRFLVRGVVRMVIDHLSAVADEPIRTMTLLAGDGDRRQ